MPCGAVVGPILHMITTSSFSSILLLLQTSHTPHKPHNADLLQSPLPPVQLQPALDTQVVSHLVSRDLGCACSCHGPELQKRMTSASASPPAFSNPGPTPLPTTPHSNPFTPSRPSRPPPTPPTPPHPTPPHPTQKALHQRHLVLLLHHHHHRRVHPGALHVAHIRAAPGRLLHGLCAGCNSLPARELPAGEGVCWGDAV